MYGFPQTDTIIHFLTNTHLITSVGRKIFHEVCSYAEIIGLTVLPMMSWRGFKNTFYKYQPKKGNHADSL